MRQAARLAARGFALMVPFALAVGIGSYYSTQALHRQTEELRKLLAESERNNAVQHARSLDDRVTIRTNQAAAIARLDDLERKVNALHPGGPARKD